MKTLKELFGSKKKSEPATLDFIVINHPVEHDVQPQEINLDLEVIDDHIVGMVNDTVVKHKCYRYGAAMIEYMPMYCKILEYAKRITEMCEDVNFDVEQLPKYARCELDETHGWYTLGSWSDSITLDLLTSDYLYQEFSRLDELKNKYKLFRKCYGIVKHLYNQAK